MEFEAIKILKNIKFPHIIQHNNLYYIYGLKTINDKCKGNNHFKLFYMIYTLDFNFLKEIDIDYKFELSTLIWQIVYICPYYRFLIEQKSIDPKNHTNTNFYYYIHYDNLEKFVVDKIVPISIENHLIFGIDDNNGIAKTSKIEKDEQNPDYYWGKYLFLFYKNSKPYLPSFSRIVDYRKDKGHILHYEKQNDDGSITIIFTIRKQDGQKFYYELYQATTHDWVSFENVQNINVINNLTSSGWYCYPELFYQNSDLYMLINQDDFGKEKATLLLKLITKR